MVVVHQLKTVNPFFTFIWNGLKPWELRKNDRDFKILQEVLLREYDAETDSYSGREVRGEIIYILDNYVGLLPGYCIFSYKVISKHHWG